MCRIRSLIYGVLALAAGVVVVLFAIAPDEAASFSLYFDVECDNVYEIRCEYSLGGAPQGCQSVQNVNPEAPMPLGERICFEFTREFFEFPEKLKSEDFSFSVSVFDMNGKEYSVKFREKNGNALPNWTGSVNFYKEYSFSLTSDNGFFFTENQ